MERLQCWEITCLEKEKHTSTGPLIGCVNEAGDSYPSVCLYHIIAGKLSHKTRLFQSPVVLTQWCDKILHQENESQKPSTLQNMFGHIVYTFS